MAYFFLGEPGNQNRRQRQRERQKRLKTRDNEAPLNNTAADVRTVVLVLGGFLLTLFFVTKIALGL